MLAADDSYNRKPRTSKVATYRDLAAGNTTVGSTPHWSDRNNFDFELALDHARGNYRGETMEGGDL
jgi:hypothetical protein